MGNIQLSITITNLYILVDPLFEKVCYNLIENAIRHGETLTQIIINSEETDEALIISVEDNGTGVPEENKTLIFERGYGKNTGFGLFLVKEILSLSGIVILENGRPGYGCRFELHVPKGKFRWKSE